MTHTSTPTKNASASDASTKSAKNKIKQQQPPHARVPMRHQLSARDRYQNMSFHEQLSANFGAKGSAFEKLRDRLGIRSATYGARYQFKIIYQALCNRLVESMLIEAEYLRKRTLTMDMAVHAFEINSGQKIFPMDYGSRRVKKSKANHSVSATATPQEPETAAAPASESDSGSSSDDDKEEVDEEEDEDKNMKDTSNGNVAKAIKAVKTAITA